MAKIGPSEFFRIILAQKDWKKFRMAKFNQPQPQPTLTNSIYLNLDLCQLTSTNLCLNRPQPQPTLYFWLPSRKQHKQEVEAWRKCRLYEHSETAVLQMKVIPLYWCIFRSIVDTVPPE